MPEEIITVYKAEVDQAIKGFQDVRSEIEKNEQAEIDLAKQQGMRLKLYQEEVEDLKELKKRRDETLDPREVSEYNKRINETVGRVEKLKQQIEGAADEVETFNKEIKQTSDRSKELGKVGGDAFELLDKLSFGAAGKIREMYKAVVTVTQGMKLLRSAIISTGIGALVVAIGSVIAYFTQTKRGAELLQRAFAGLGAAVRVIVDRFASFGETIVNAFRNPQQALKDFGDALQTFLINRVRDVLSGFEGLGSAVKLLFEGEFTKAAETAGKAVLDLTTGFTLVGGVIKDNQNELKALAGEMGSAAKRAVDLEGSLQKIVDAERELSVVRAQARAQIKELNLIAEDTTKSDEERAAAARKAIELEQGLLGQRESLQQQRVTTLREQLKLDKENVSLMDDLAAAEQELGAIREESLEMQTTLNNKLNAIETQRLAKAEADAKALLDLQKAQRDLALLLVEEAAAQEQAILDRQLAEQLISQQQYNDQSYQVALIRIDQLLSLEQEGTLRYDILLSQRAQIEKAYADQGVATEKEKQAGRLKEIEEAFQKEQLALERKFLKGEVTEEGYYDALHDIQQRALDRELEETEKGTVRYEEILTEKLRSDEEYYDKKKELREKDEEEEEEQRRKAVDAVLDLSEFLAGELAANAEARAAQADEERNKKVEAFQEEIQRINEELETARGADRARLLSRKATLDQSVRDENEYAASVIQKERERALNYKRAQITIMTIQEAVALARAFAELGPIAGAVAALAIGVKFAILMSQVESAKFAKGTEYLQRGKNRPGVDTIPIWANEGEAIIPTDRNKERPGMAKAWIKGNLDEYINQHHVMPRVRELVNLSRQNTGRMSQITASRAASEREVRAILNDGRLLAGLRDLKRTGKRSNETSAQMIVEAINKKHSRRGA